MLFNSQIFLFAFLPIVLVGFGIAAHFGRNSVVGWLTFASLVFFSGWKPIFLLILAASIVGNFFVSRMIAFDQRPMRRMWLIVGIAANLGLLGCFKYLPAILNVFRGAGADPVQILLPLGISFFTFTQIGYLVDLEQGEAEVQDFLSYALFVTFFPHLIAGPILHHKEIMPQFGVDRRFALCRSDLMVGGSYFVFGLFKKVVVADSIAPYANSVFADPGNRGAMVAWIGAVIYFLELYFDFSGYSDMAIGLARMFSIRFPMNFDSPYKAASVLEFWSRWHMTLTRYVTLYVYNPLSVMIRRRRLASGKKVLKEVSKTMGGFILLLAVPTIVSMLLAGIWHGAGLQFVIFGLIFGVCMTLEHLWFLFRKNKKPRNLIFQAASVLRVNLIVMMAFIFFHSASTSSALSLLASMFGLHANAANGRLQTLVPLPIVAVTCALLVVVWFAPNSQEILSEVIVDQGESFGRDRIYGRTGSFFGWRWKPNLVWAVVVGFALSLSLINLNNSTTFLYFQF